MVFKPNTFTEKISFRTPAKMLKDIAHLGLKNRLAIITLLKRRSGLTLNILT
jgi:hypothetical protein